MKLSEVVCKNECHQSINTDQYKVHKPLGLENPSEVLKTTHWLKGNRTEKNVCREYKVYIFPIVDILKTRLHH